MLFKEEEVQQIPSTVVDGSVQYMVLLWEVEGVTDTLTEPLTDVTQCILYYRDKEEEHHAITVNTLL